MNYYQIKAKIPLDSKVGSEILIPAVEYLKRRAEILSVKYLGIEKGFLPECTPDGQKFLMSLSLEELTRSLNRTASSEVAPKSNNFPNPESAYKAREEAKKSASDMLKLLETYCK